MKAKYKFHLKEKLLAEAFYGKIGMADLIRIVEQQAQHPEFNEANKTISDIRDSDFQLSLEELDDYIQQLKTLMKNQALRWAIVTNNPNSTALSMLIKQDSFFDNRIQVFCTVSASLKFLGVDMNPDSLLQNNYFIVE